MTNIFTGDNIPIDDASGILHSSGVLSFRVSRDFDEVGNGNMVNQSADENISYPFADYAENSYRLPNNFFTFP